MWGTFGAPVTDALIDQKAAQYPDFYTPDKIAELRQYVGKNYFAFDCVGLIKATLWGWLGFPNYSYGGAIYGANGVPDVSADTMFQQMCINPSSDFTNIVPGEAVWMPGHIGVYIGDGRVVECTTRWTNNVLISACLNIGWIAGLNGRKWEKHGRLPWVEYETPILNNYTVVTGDSLWSIAYKMLGDGTRYGEIMELNKLTSDVIHVGQVLKLPAR
jgi:hypothetical protein